MIANLWKSNAKDYSELIEANQMSIVFSKGTHPDMSYIFIVQFLAYSAQRMRSLTVQVI